MGLPLLTKLKAKLDFCLSIFHGNIQLCLARLAGPSLHYFPNTVKEEGFLSLVEGYGQCVVQGELVSRSIVQELQVISLFFLTIQTFHMILTN